MRSSVRPEPLLDEAALTRAIDSHGLVMFVPAARRSSAKTAGPATSHEAGTSGCRLCDLVVGQRSGQRALDR